MARIGALSISNIGVARDIALPLIEGRCPTECRGTGNGFAGFGRVNVRFRELILGFSLFAIDVDEYRQRGILAGSRKDNKSSDGYSAIAALDY